MINLYLANFYKVYETSLNQLQINHLILYLYESVFILVVEFLKYHTTKGQENDLYKY